MSMHPGELQQIAHHIEPLFDEILNRYSYEKYPAEDYRRCKAAFADRSCAADDIKEALLWKWGYSGRTSYPAAHQNLIKEIQGHWPEFAQSDPGRASSETFAWWSDKLGRPTTYITSAYITHLIHHAEPVPIIDQHNFRAMNALLAIVRPGHRGKKKPSNWSDVEQLKSFMLALSRVLELKDFGDLDRFLMMYGRYVAPR